MGQGMGKGDWSAAAQQILTNDPPGTKVWISDTVSQLHGNPPHQDAYEATKLPGGGVDLRKYHSS